VGDVFGAPLAIEALLAFFLESVFLGVWIFGWDKLSKGMHLATIWLVAIGSSLSALWILVANSFMQQPGWLCPGERPGGDERFWRAADQFLPLDAVSTHGAFRFYHRRVFVLGISAYHLVRRRDTRLFRRSFQIASMFGVLSIFLVILVGHTQAQRMVRESADEDGCR
jgi:cytochrome bd ubiquinol oxidase subunit I